MVSYLGNSFEAATKFFNNFIKSFFASPNSQFFLLFKAFNNGFDDGTNNKGIQVFKNMIANSISRELAQKCAEISGSLVEKALSEM